MGPNRTSLIFLLLLVLHRTDQLKERSACSVIYTGCNIAGGRCRCHQTVDRCVSPFQFPTVELCRAALFDQDPEPEGTASPHLYPECRPAQYAPLCAPAHVASKWCHGECDSGCCVIGGHGCLPPTNVYVPATSCAEAHKDACKGHVCPRGYKCDNVKQTHCPVLPCRKRARCVVDDDYNPCPQVTCPQTGSPRVCVRKRSKCGEERCPYSFSCELLSCELLYENPLSTVSKYRCPYCPSITPHQSFCQNHFAARIKINEILWHKRFYKSLGRCDWYSSTVEYIIGDHHHHRTSSLSVGNATLLLYNNQETSCTCICLNTVTPGERFFMVGIVVGHAYDGMPQTLHVPYTGLIQPWHLVKKRVLHHLKRSDC